MNKRTRSKAKFRKAGRREVRRTLKAEVTGIRPRVERDDRYERWG